MEKQKVQQLLRKWIAEQDSSAEPLLIGKSLYKRICKRYPAWLVLEVLGEMLLEESRKERERNEYVQLSGSSLAVLISKAGI